MKLTIRPSFAAALIALSAASSSAAIPEAAKQTADQRAVLAADAKQRLAVASVDVKAIGEISDPHLRVNAPSNRILTRDDLMRMVASGEIRNEVFERTPEDVVITGDVGVVMGHEVRFSRNRERASPDVRAQDAQSPLHQCLYPFGRNVAAPGATRQRDHGRTDSLSAWG
jgi:hypothetical protein